jgi:hypothetical protein
VRADHCKDCGHHIDWHPDDEWDRVALLPGSAPDGLCATDFDDVEVVDRTDPIVCKLSCCEGE